MRDMYIWLAVAVIALVTALTRFLPFLIWAGNRTMPPILDKLGKVLPYAIMGMLVVYCLKEVTLSSLSGFLPELIAGAVVVVSYIWKRNTLVSIIGGTLCYMLFVQVVF